VIAVQEPASIVALGAVFSQDTHPFPTDAVSRCWREEISAAGIDCFVVVDGLEVVGFGAVKGNEILHFGIALERWGTGLAGQAHDALLGVMRVGGVERAWLRVFTGNGRARAFYEKRGWHPTGERTTSTFEPHPELLHYERNIGPFQASEEPPQ
jgi:RimJ/RimL family protein N-acetyltransferase